MMKKKLLIILLHILLPLTLLGQRYISGRITDAEDGSSIPSATVFITNTTVGTTTDSDGYYRLRIPSNGSFQLSVSHVGYQSVFKDLEPGNTSVELDIAMNIHVLDDVVVSTTVRFRQRDVNLFWRTILGQNPSKRAINVLNSESVYYYYNAETRILTVTCREPLQIINYETGYQIQYILNNFTHDYDKDVTEWNHQYNFTELEPDNNRQKNRRQKKRQDVYHMSLSKFIKSLYNNSLHDDGFVLTNLHQNSDHSYKISLLNVDSILSIKLTDNSKTLNLSDEQVMLICYGKPVTDDDLTFLQQTEGEWFIEKSSLFMSLLHGDSIHIFADGTYSNRLQMAPINSSGTLLGLNKRLPFEYLPEELALSAMEDDNTIGFDSIVRHFDTQLHVFQQEKLHLHTDRDYYVPGEKIWFKAYVADAVTHQHSTQSRYVYVELISPADTLVHRVMVRPEDGMFYGYMPITEIVPEGSYTLRAYTRYMENLGDDYFFKKHIRITPLPPKEELTQNRPSKPIQSEAVHAKTERNRQDFDVSFFPEGGNLLEGVLCKMAFKALNSYGTSANIIGEVIDENGLAVISVESFHAGMGAFNFLPEPGKKYTLKCRNSNGLEKQFSLPQPHPNAYTLAIGQQKQNKKIAIEMRKSINAPDIPCYLLVHCRGMVLHFSYLDDVNESIAFSEEDLPAGVIHLMLFDEQMNPLSERLVFNKNNEDLGMIDFHTDKANYGRREKVIATLSLADAFENLLSGHLSVAVTDNADIAVDSSTTILSTLLLSSELRGYIENPAYYLQDDRKAITALDYLMMTHGWRRYNVPEVVKGNMELPPIPYQASQELAGNVKSVMLSRPVSGSEVLIVVEQDMGSVLTDESGRFAVQDFEYPDSTSYFIQALNNRGGSRVKLTLDDALFPALTHAPQTLAEVMPTSREETKSDTVSNAFLVKAEQRSQYDEDMRTIHLSEVEITAPIIKKELRLEFWANRSADKTIRREQFERHHPTSVSDILRSAGIRVSSNGEISLGRGTGGRPLVLIDGVYMVWPEELFSPYESPIESINVNMVESIDIISGVGTSIFGVRGVNGAISITTKRGQDAPVESFNDNISIFTPLGYQKPAAFYSPKYETSEAKAFHVPDFRTTIFWKPDVVISDEHETAGFEFYTSDFPTSYSVVIEGLTISGKIVRQVKTIIVE